MIVIDIETSGLHASENSILSLGAVDFYDQENYFYCECRARENSIIDPEALAINGFDINKISSNKKSCEQLLKEFLEWSLKVKDRTLAGFGIAFDIEFLRQHFKIYNINWPFRSKYIDFHSILYYYLLKNKLEIPLKKGISAMNLDYVLSYLNIKGRSGEYHNALEDAKLTAEAFSLLLEEK